jgi:hypothetical protein
MRIAGTSQCSAHVGRRSPADGTLLDFRDSVLSAGRLRWSFANPIDLDSEASVSVRGSDTDGLDAGATNQDQPRNSWATRRPYSGFAPSLAYGVDLR